MTFYAANSSAQQNTPPLERIVTISFNNETRGNALKQLAETAQVTFSYSATAFDGEKIIQKNFNAKSVREILEILFNGEVQYKQKGNYIILTKRTQNDGVLISGYVVDESTGQKLKEVSIYDPISLQSTVTDDFGYFELEVKKPTDEEMKLAIKKNMYGDTILTVRGKQSSFQQINLNFDKEKWKAFSDSVDSKLDKVWAWTKKSVQKINMQNIRDTLQRDWQVSFIPFIGTNHKLSGNVINDYSLNILGGYSAGTTKAEFGGLFNINRGNVKHVQAAGLFNLNGGIASGVQLAGLFNTNLDSAHAVQLAGLVNFNQKSSLGVQAAGLINLNIGSYHGPQLAGLFNLVTKNIDGVQVAGLFNVTPGYAGGVQIAGLFNVSKEVRGSQVSGLINFSKTVHGTQIGLINIADSIRGVPVGFLSFVKKGYHKIEIATDETMPVNISLRTGVRQFYNILSAGFRPAKSDTVSWSFGYGLGASSKLSNKLFLNTDYTSQQLVKGNVKALNLINKFYAGIDYQLTKKISITAGGTFNLRIYDKDYQNHASTFYSYEAPIQKSGAFSKTTNYQVWWGAKVGLRFF